MKVAMIARSTLFTGRGGDTIQVEKTAHYLREIGVEVDIILSNEKIKYAEYDLLHFFNITRPADLLNHSIMADKPYVISTVLLDYSEYDQYHRGKIGYLFRLFSTDAIEYLKAIARFLLLRDHLASLQFIWQGQRKSIMKLLRGAAMLLPNSPSEYIRLVNRFGVTTGHMVIPNGVDLATFNDPDTVKDPNLVLCVARIEGNKNQLNLVKALNNTRFKVIIIGKPAPNQMEYYAKTLETAASNIEFIPYIPQPELIKYYQQAKVHILPSWFETTGLSTLEAAVMGCNIVITDKGDTRSYFEDHAFYCDPGSPASIYQAVETASKLPYDKTLYQKIINQYTWQKTAEETLKSYQLVLSKQSQTNYTPNHESLVSD